MNYILSLLLSLLSWANVWRRRRLIFPIDGTSSVQECTRNTDFKLGDTTAKLAMWVYSPSTPDEKGPMTPLPEGLRMKQVHRTTKDSPLQWAIVTSDDTVYVVFKGSDRPTDILIVNSAIAPIHAFHDKSIVVHGGAWNALHSYRDMVTDNIKGILKAAIADKPSINVVLCGHSLGGAYAILCALELLHGDEGVKVDHVIGHGAPQVIEPNTANKVWNELNLITTIYINEYDVVPRLPSCHKEWRETLKKGPQKPLSRFIQIHGHALSDTESTWQMFERLDRFRHVGKLVFTARNESGITNYRVHDAIAPDGTDGHGWDVLRKPPAWSGTFIIENHNEYPQVLHSLLQARTPVEECTQFL
jgi:hypothetical protein